MRATSTFAVALRAAALALSISPTPATAQQPPPGTPQPSRGAPGAGTDVFGTSGGEALRPLTPEELAAAGIGQKIEDIVVEGGGPASTVRAHVTLRVGDVLTVEAIVASRARLLQAGAFTRVTIGTRPGSAAGLVVLVVTVDERSPVQLGGIWFAQTPVARPYGGLELAAPNVAGRAFGLSIGAAVDANGRVTGRLTLYEPDLRVAGRSWVAGLRGLGIEGLESACATPGCGGVFASRPWVRYRRIGAEIVGGFRPGPFSRFIGGWRFEELRASTDPGAAPEARPEIIEGRSRLSALVVAFDLDTRTDTFLAANGWRLGASATIGTAAISSDYEYSRFLLEVERWVPRQRGRALRFDLAVGLLQGNAPFFERFYAADWSYFSIGYAAPRVLELNFSPDSRYDAVLLVVGTEYNVPLWQRPHRLLQRAILALGARFVVTAAVPAAAPSRISQVPVSLDAALRFDTRYGVINLGLGYVIDQVIKALPLKIPAVQER